jgi:hypothetical protein
MNNPPAFPRPASDAHQHGMHKPQDGMSLRDYFAAKAMQGFISASTTQLIAPDIRLQARSSYFVADEMLKAREA